MVDTGRYDIQLAGCTPEPLIAYLKALGILRQVSEQKDVEARGWWKKDVFWLRSSLDRDALAESFSRNTARRRSWFLERRRLLPRQLAGGATEVHENANVIQSD